MTEEQRLEFDKMLAEVKTQQESEKLSLPEVLGDYQAVKGKPGIYMRPMCLEVEMRALDLYSELSDGTAVGLAKIALSLAEGLLYKVNTEGTKDEQFDRAVQFVRGTVGEEAVFVPLSKKEVGRLFKSTTELDELVLKPLGLAKEEVADPNEEALTG